MFVAVVGYYLFFHASDAWVDLAVRAAILSIIFLSITVITGFAGQISLCQASFAAIGACATAQLATNEGLSIIPAMFVGALLAAVVGGIIALPALRLGGIFLSLATLAFAFFFQNVILNFSWVGGGFLPIQAPRPLIFGIDFSTGKNNGDNKFLLLALIMLTIVSILVIWVRSGTTGRYLDAMRGSEVAAASIGINRNRARIVAFSLSAAIAGLGGGLFASYEGAVNNEAHYIPALGLAWIVLVVTLGARTVEGAINAAVGFVFFQAVVLPTWIPWVVNSAQPVYHMSALPAGLQPILFGLGALTYAKHPEGILEFQKRRSLARVQRVIDRFKGRGPAGASGVGRIVGRAGRARPRGRTHEHARRRGCHQALRGDHRAEPGRHRGRRERDRRAHRAERRGQDHVLQLSARHPEARRRLGALRGHATSRGSRPTGGRAWGSAARSSASSCSRA